SHPPPCEVPRQWVDDDANPSAGHAPEVPGHVSATSHWPAESRHVWPAARKTSTHALLIPEQWSAASLSQSPPCEVPVQLVDAGAKPFAGQLALEPVHCAATSQGPAAARHTVPAFPAGCAHAPAPSQTSSVQTLPSLVQGVAAAVWQLSAASLQLLSHSGPPAHGSPLCVQTPALQLS